VAKAAGSAEVEEAWRARGLGVAVGHRHGARFLQHPDVADIRGINQRIDQRQFGCAWIAEDVAYTFAAQHFETAAPRRGRCRSSVAIGLVSMTKSPGRDHTSENSSTMRRQ
jgi:hypothetical protein